MTVVRTVSCHLAGVRFAWFGLCLRSRGCALLRCVWDGVRVSFWIGCCVGERWAGSIGSIAGLRLWVVVCMVVSLAFNWARVSWRLGCLIGFFTMLLLLDSGYLAIRCFDGSMWYCLVIIFVRQG